MDGGARYRTLLVLLVLAHALLAGAYSVWNPLAEAPDEADHWAYVRYLSTERQLPAGPRVTQSKHPPLYHAMAAVVATVGDPGDYQFLRANPDVSLNPAPHWSPNFFIHTTLESWPWQAGPLAFHMARLWSALLSSATVLAAYFLVRAGFPDWPGMALVTAGVLAFIPEFAFIGGSVNNDNGAALLGTLVLLGVMSLYWRGGIWQRAWWTPIAMGLGLLVKVSTVALWPVVMLAVIMGAVRAMDEDDASTRSWALKAAGRWRRWTVSCLIVLAIAIAIASPWLIRNRRTYGDPLGYSIARQTIDLRMGPWTLADTVWLLQGWFESFWGKFGGAGHIPMPSWVYWTLAAICLVSATGLVRAWYRFTPTYRPVIFLLLLSVLTVALGIWRYSLIALGTDQGRLLYPSIGAIVTLLVLGLAAWTPARWQPFVATAGIAALAALSVYGLAGVIRPAFAPPPSLILTEAPNTSEAGPVQFGMLTLADWQMSSSPVLHWYASEHPDADWRTTLRVVSEDGSLVWEWRRSPGHGRWSTDHWPAGTLLKDEYSVAWPEWTEPGRYRVEVSAHPFGSEPSVPTIDGNPAAPQDHPYFFLGWLERQ